MTKLYVTSTTYKPASGRSLVLPEGCTAVLYVCPERARAAELSHNGTPTEIDLDLTTGSLINVDLATGRITKL